MVGIMSPLPHPYLKMTEATLPAGSKEWMEVKGIAAVLWAGAKYQVKKKQQRKKVHIFMLETEREGGGETQREAHFMESTSESSGIGDKGSSEQSRHQNPVIFVCFLLLLFSLTTNADAFLPCE